MRHAPAEHSDAPRHTHSATMPQGHTHNGKTPQGLASQKPLASHACYTCPSAVDVPSRQLVLGAGGQHPRAGRRRQRLSPCTSHECASARWTAGLPHANRAIGAPVLSAKAACRVQHAFGATGPGHRAVRGGWRVGGCLQRQFGAVDGGQCGLRGLRGLLEWRWRWAGGGGRSKLTPPAVEPDGEHLIAKLGHELGELPVHVA